MRARDNIALNLAPVPIRLALACIFVWAGLGKVMGTFPVSGSDAAILGNLGVGLSTPAGYDAADEPADEPADVPVEEPMTRAFNAGPVVVLAAQDDRYSPSDFPDPIDTLRVNGLVLLMHKAADGDRFTADRDPIGPIWPGWAGDAPWVKVLAWLAAITEVLFGFLLLIGLFTRLGALNMCGIMLVAIWLTQIGPAIQTGQTMLGFLPNHDVFDTSAWQPLLFQVSVLAGSGSLLLLGPGSISVDAMAFAKKDIPGESDEDEEEDEFDDE
jgi:uncharacterized membrane protein YphA (DoxX/SURF4 family)